MFRPIPANGCQKGSPLHRSCQTPRISRVKKDFFSASRSLVFQPRMPTRVDQRFELPPLLRAFWTPEILASELQVEASR